MKSSQSQRRRYSIVDSPFFKLKGKGQLARLLKFDINELPALLHEDNYRVWTNEKGREIQAPARQLANVHKRIAYLLARIEVPDYVYSQKGRSHIENALQHVGNSPLIKTDINKFYPSITHGMVTRLFLNDFKCAGDVAHTIADICCFQQTKLPTGSALSGYVAFLAARPMFDQIELLAMKNDTKLTVLVDDVTISGTGANRALLLEVRRLVRQSGLSTRGGKSKFYSGSQPKPVTGAIVVANGLLLPNRQHKKIRQTRNELVITKPAVRASLKARLRGQLVAASQVLKHGSN